MRLPPIIRKIPLVLFGLVSALVLFELSLCLSVYLQTLAQERANLASLKENGEFVILCLGESTTQTGGSASFPRQMEEILNHRDFNIKFTVINKGISGTNTAYIATGLKENLMKYHPDMVITMMGINDGPSTIVYEDTPVGKSPLFFERFQVYKLAQRLGVHIAYMINEWNHPEMFSQSQANKDTLYPEKLEAHSDRQKAGVPVITNNSAEEIEDLLSQGDQLLLRGDLEEAGKLYQRAVVGAPDKCYHRYIKLARLYHRKEDNPAQAEEYYKKAIALNPENDKAYAPGGDGLISLYREQNKWEEAERLAEKVVKLNPGNFQSYSELGRCYEQKGRTDEAIEMYNKSFDLNPFHNQPFAKLTYFNNKLGRIQEVERICQKRISIKPDDDKAYAALAVSYSRQGKKELARKYFAKVDELRASFYNRTTAQNYRKLIEMILENSSQPVCVQYPMRNISDLKKMIPDQEGIIFVDNEKIFKTALKQDSYEDYFVDQFAGDFGHCTPKGNYLLANNIVAILMDSYFKGMGTIRPCPENTQINGNNRFERLNLLVSEAKTLTASSRNRNDQIVNKLNDNDKSTYWHVSLKQIGEPAWITIDFGRGNEQTVKSLAALPRKDIPRQFLRTAELFGSDNGENWKFISDILQSDAPDNTIWREWKFDNDRAFRYYKLLILDGHEDGNAHRFYSFAELALFE